MTSREWINFSRVSTLFLKGVDDFISFAYANRELESKIKCPCKKCRNTVSQDKMTLREHLIMNGFQYSYTTWIFHGEPSYATASSVGGAEDMSGMLRDAFGFHDQDNDTDNCECHGDAKGPDESTSKLFNLMRDANSELYDGCKKYTVLSFVIRIFNMKVMNKWSHKSCTMLLELLKDAFPLGDNFPNSYLKLWKIVRDLGFDYQKIHACPNNCMLYWKENKDLTCCKVCNEPRWKKSPESDDEDGKIKAKNFPAKVMRYFPLAPRLQKLFISQKNASFMRWHKEERNDDGILRHPADSRAWKDFDQRHLGFSCDCRNVRLGLSADGFNPFRSRSISHSTWGVVLTIYNMPPWMCLKQPYLVLSTLIDGPNGLGNNIDVFLQPLVDELKMLWEDGIDTYDADSREMFTMRVAILWTISDFPAYANLSGWSTKGRLACPNCNEKTYSNWLKHGRKSCYMGHRRWLHPSHPFRYDSNSFDGTIEVDTKPILLTRDDLLNQLEISEFGNNPNTSTLGKHERGKEKTNVSNSLNWKKKSIFLSYHIGRIILFATI